jgi:hypothetical protein
MNLPEQSQKPQQTFLKLMLKREALNDGLFMDGMHLQSPSLNFVMKSPSIFRSKNPQFSILNSPSILFSVENLNFKFFPDPVVEKHLARQESLFNNINVP